MATAPSLRSYDPTFLHCRGFSHAFTVIGYYVDGLGNVKRRLRCRDCKTIGHDTLSRTGERRKGRSYTYPDGYLVEGGFPRQEVRREQIRRAGTIYGSEDQMLASIRGGTHKPPTKKATYPVKHRQRAKAGANR